LAHKYRFKTWITKIQEKGDAIMVKDHISRLIKPSTYAFLAVLLLFWGGGLSVAQKQGTAKVVFVVA
jgi:hypothetical protein